MLLPGQRPSGATIPDRGDPHTEFQSLLIIEPRIDLRLVGSGEISVCQASCSTGALGDVVSRQLEMNAAQMAAHLVVDFECEFQFAKNPIEATRFQAR